MLITLLPKQHFFKNSEDDASELLGNICSYKVKYERMNVLKLFTKIHDKVVDELLHKM